MTKAERAFLYEYRPYRFAVERLGMDEDPVLERFLTSTSKELLWVGSRQTGKTTGFSIKACHVGIFVPRSLAVIVSATQRQAGILQRRVTGFLRRLRRQEKWRRVRDVDVPEDPLDENSRLVRCSVLSLELANGSEVVSVPATPDTVRGYSPDLILVDEAARVPNAVYEAIRPMRAVTGATLAAGSTAGVAGGGGFTRSGRREIRNGSASRCGRRIAHESPRRSLRGSGES